MSRTFAKSHDLATFHTAAVIDVVVRRHAQDVDMMMLLDHVCACSLVNHDICLLYLVVEIHHTSSARRQMDCRDA